MKYKVAERSSSMRVDRERKVPFRAANTRRAPERSVSPACMRFRAPLCTGREAGRVASCDLLRWGLWSGHRTGDQADDCPFGCGRDITDAGEQRAQPMTWTRSATRRRRSQLVAWASDAETDWSTSGRAAPDG